MTHDSYQLQCGLVSVPFTEETEGFTFSPFDFEKRLKLFHHKKDSEKEVWFFDELSKDGYELHCFTHYFKRGEKKVLVGRNVYFERLGPSRETLKQQREKWIERLGGK